MIDLSQCLGDSPAYRETVHRIDGHLSSLESGLKTLCKAIRQSIESTQSLANANMAVAEALAEVGKVERRFVGAALASAWTPATGATEAADGEGRLDVLQSMAQEIMVIELNRKQHAWDMEQTVLDSLEAFAKHDLGSAKDFKRRWERTGMEATHLAARYMAKKARDPGLFEAAQELAESRKEYHSAALDYCQKLNELHVRKETKMYSALSQHIGLLTVFTAKQQEAVGELADCHTAMTQRMANGAADMSSVSSADALDVKKRLLLTDETFYNPLYIDRSATPVQHSRASESTASTSTHDTPSVRKEGYLYKRSSHSVRSVWSRRYFVLYSERLEYYSLQEGNAPIPIDLRLCAVKQTLDSERRFCFELVSPVKSFTLQAETEQDAEAWQEAVSSAIKAALQSGPGPVTGAAGSDPGSVPDDDQLLEEHRLERPMSHCDLAFIKGIEGNSSCAECGSEESLEWAVVNYGILVCIACSGVHRGLGTQVSKVRSLELDFWEPAQVEIMRGIGNARSNSILEATCKRPEATGYYAKPTPDSTQAVREQWVTAKYDMNKFVSNGPDPDWCALLWRAIESNDLAGLLDAILHGADPDYAAQCTHPLLYALRAERHAAALLLMFWGADVTLAEPDTGATALHIVAGTPSDSLASHSMTLALLKRGAIPDAPDAKGNEPIDIAEANGNRLLQAVLRAAMTHLDFEVLRLSTETDETEGEERKKKGLSLRARQIHKLTQKSRVLLNRVIPHKAAR